MVARRHGGAGYALHARRTGSQSYLAYSPAETFECAS
jgi:hypothetical protein